MASELVMVYDGTTGASRPISVDDVPSDAHKVPLDRLITVATTFTIPALGSDVSVVLTTVASLTAGQMLVFFNSSTIPYVGRIVSVNTTTRVVVVKSIVLASTTTITSGSVCKIGFVYSARATGTLAQLEAITLKHNGFDVFVTNGRKLGEVTGAGTGIPGWFSTTDNKFKTYSDNSNVSI